LIGVDLVGLARLRQPINKPKERKETKIDQKDEKHKNLKVFEHKRIKTEKTKANK